MFWGSDHDRLIHHPRRRCGHRMGTAAIILAVNGHVITAIVLAAFCAAVIGSLDNLLRPILVGKDTQMHELMIFFGTLGGIVMFGVVGIIIGPIVAALFTTVWEIYGVAFRDILPAITVPISEWARQPHRRRSHRSFMRSLMQHLTRHPTKCRRKHLIRRHTTRPNAELRLPRMPVLTFKYMRSHVSQRVLHFFT